MKEKIEKTFESSIKGTIFEKVCHLAELNQEEELRDLTSGESIDIVQGNYLPVGYLAKKGKLDAVMLLIEKFAANKHHAALCAAWGEQEELINLLISKENDARQFDELIYHITRGFVRRFNRDIVAALWVLRRSSDGITTLINRFVDEDLFFKIQYDELFLDQFASSLDSNYFFAESCLAKVQFKSAGVDSSYLGVKYQYMALAEWNYFRDLRLCIVDYQLEPLQAEKLLAATQGLRIWLLQAVRQLSMGLYIDENGMLQNTDNERPKLPIEILFHITTFAFNLPEICDARKIMIAENRRLSNAVIEKNETEMSYSHYSVIPQVLSFFGINGPKEKKKQIEGLIKREEDRYEKRISCIPPP
ncbi:hypothetical protein [Fluoribacter gormanii]|uniref:Uncharacterized protein n=1 Tax=Fluoribacter gormanii TaxID=464 RepID=A0A377GJN7_9GAMM|nr:hypothetical protein [Fluoribacter gormanii]KTD00357.1 hypothetical protein Lgor_3252 [Fluoribacter gormanii]MCW8443711.1 hypothetical protein [Fluoribacter gormanii]SIQ92438.1 hypothetical protein SAMN05421777_104132 [Fluoribacter gormanii]STO24735.1 Uncharacterised protein [Fluoribacter gormanii]